MLWPAGPPAAASPPPPAQLRQPGPGTCCTCHLLLRAAVQLLVRSAGAQAGVRCSLTAWKLLPPIPFLLQAPGLLAAPLMGTPLSALPASHTAGTSAFDCEDGLGVHVEDSLSCASLWALDLQAYLLDAARPATKPHCPLRIALAMLLSQRRQSWSAGTRQLQRQEFEDMHDFEPFRQARLRLYSGIAANCVMLPYRK